MEHRIRIAGIAGREKVLVRAGLVPRQVEELPLARVERHSVPRCEEPGPHDAQRADFLGCHVGILPGFGPRCTFHRGLCVRIGENHRLKLAFLLCSLFFVSNGAAAIHHVRFLFV